MAFHKVVKKLAHIKNYPHKKSEWKQKRVKWLLDYVRMLLWAILMNRGRMKWNYYEQLRAIEQELKDLGCYDSRVIWCMTREAILEHNRYRRW